jgi:hypothetical protein
MIINAPTILFTLVIIGVGGYAGLKLIRQFALSIALENHEANVAQDTQEEKSRQKKMEMVDAAANAAFMKVQPLLPLNHGSGTTSPIISPNSSDLV